jgi:hypothetical protein
MDGVEEEPTSQHNDLYISSLPPFHSIPSGGIRPRSTHRALSCQRRHGRDVIREHCSQAHRDGVARDAANALSPEAAVSCLVVIVAEIELCLPLPGEQLASSSPSSTP